MPKLSAHFQSRKPSAIRMAQISFMERKDDVKAINCAIGNVSLPMHPAMQKRMFNLEHKDSPFKEGVVKYSATVGFEETNKAVLNVIASSGFKVEGLYTQITDGGSAAMELVILGVCDDRPLMLIDAAYTNYNAMADRLGKKTVSVSRILRDDGKFTLPDIEEIENVIKKEKPSALVVIPYDNPTGHFYEHKIMERLAELCVKYDLWMISDEAYRELFYLDEDVVSVWGLGELSGIKGRRISIETASKVWNACGLRIGALVSDSKEFIDKSVAENTANLCPNVIGQYIFGALAHESHGDLKKWYAKQRSYYQEMMVKFAVEMKKLLPDVIVSSPDAAIYSVIDVRNIMPEFDAMDFVMWCASHGKVDIDNENYTLLLSPMSGFYADKEKGRTQMRVAYVESPENMEKVPMLFKRLLEEYAKSMHKD